MKDILIEIVQKHIPSFLKTYLTVFIGGWLLGVELNQEVFSQVFLIANAKVSLVAGVRTIYKFLDEDASRVAEGKSVAREYIEK